MKTAATLTLISVSLLILTGIPARAQHASAIDTRAADFDAVMGFELGSGDELPSLWSINGSVMLDRDIVHSGRAAARIRLDDGERGGTAFLPFSELTVTIPFDFEGTTVELRGYMRSENVSRRIPPFMQQRSSDTLLADPITGTNDWTQFEVTVPVDPNAHTLELGVMFNGEGTIWVDDLEVFVDGRPLREVPRIEKLTAQEKTALIARAERAGPPSVARDATIKTVFGGEIRVLREGSNGWTCWGETQGLGPMCNEPGWDDWLMAYWNNEESFSVDRLSVSYMLAAEGERPHVMILVPEPATLDELSRSGRDPVWAMWTNSPYAHIMLNTGDDVGPGSAATGFGSARIERLTLPPPPYIAFEPIEMSQNTLERYAGIYAASEIPPALAEQIPEERRDEFLASTVVTVTAHEQELTFHRKLGEVEITEAYRPASETRFIEGQNEILFEFDNEGRVMRFMQQTGFGDEWMAHERIE